MRTTLVRGKPYGLIVSTPFPPNESTPPLGRVEAIARGLGFRVPDGSAHQLSGVRGLRKLDDRILALNDAGRDSFFCMGVWDGADRALLDVADVEAYELGLQSGFFRPSVVLAEDADDGGVFWPWAAGAAAAIGGGVLLYMKR